MESRSFSGNGTNGCHGDWCKVRSRGEAALAYCEGLTVYDLEGLPPLHAGLAEHFSQEKQIAEIAATGINENS